jgi:hypothetical protein
MLFLLASLALVAQAPGTSIAAASGKGLDLVYEDSLAPGPQFPLGHERFWFSDRAEWLFVDSVADNGLGDPVPDSGPALTFKSTKSYQPRVRSPHSLALLRGHEQRGDFAFEVEAMQTGIETPHRDLVLVFGFQSHEQFYYCHLGASPDAHSSNIFEVNEAPRRRVGEVSTKTIEWGRGVWHRLRVECTFGGRVRVFIDDAKEPHFEEELGRNPQGLIGFGSFDDAGAFRNLKVYGQYPKPGAWNPSAILPKDHRRYWRTSPFGGTVAVDSGWGRFAVGRSSYKLVSVTGGRWSITEPTSGLPDAEPVHLPLDVAYVSGDRLSILPILDPEGAFKAPFTFRVGPAHQSRSEFIQAQYNQKSQGHPAKGQWSWAVDGFGPTADERPILFANTPHGSPESWRWDEELFANPEVAERLARDFVLYRADSSLARVHQLVPLWVATNPLERGAPSMVIRARGLGHLGIPLSKTNKITTPASLLKWLDETMKKEPRKIRIFDHSRLYDR